MSIVKAERIDQIYKAFKGEPLHMEDMDAFYQNTTEARGGVEPRRRIARILRQNQDSDEQLLFVGYKGCGKSTELNHLQKDIQNDFLVLNFSVMEELDPVQLNYIELFIVTMERLFDVAKERNFRISKEYLQSIQHWLGTKEIEEIREKYNLGAEAEVGAEGNYGIPYLQTFFYKFKLSAKSSRSLKETLKTNVEPKLSDLIQHCNTLITEIRQQLPAQGLKDLVLIIEDLDKIPLDRAQELFFNYTNQLVQLRTNVIYTFPIALYHSIRFNNIKTYFTNLYELPMIKVAQKDGTPEAEGMQTMCDIVSARMNYQTLFENQEILNTMIRQSGGCLRDLFLMIREAADNAADHDREIITEDDRFQAYQKLKREYANTIADNVVGNIKYPVEKYYETLVKLTKSTTKQLDNTEEEMHLKQNLCILGYNGEGWCDVHPIVKDILRERGKL